MVAARETTLQELLEGSKQYQVPLYQRTYSWTRPQLSRLWEDVLTLAEERITDPKATHFIGSLVLASSPTNGPAGVSEYLVVDGQQRLTTLSVLLCAIRDHRAGHEGPEHRERIDQQYLLNRWKGEQHRLKLVPTQADRAAFLACMDSTPQAGGADPVGAAYRFFSAELLAVDDPDDPADIDRIEDAVIAGLALVSVTVQPGDNAHRIFESLNNTGLRLTQGDLLRNYLFMRLPSRADVVHQSLWLPLQSELSSSELELLFWLDLVHRDPRVKQTDTYAGQQKRLERLGSESQIEAEIGRICSLGRLLKRILEPSREMDAAVRQRLVRLNQWGTTTVYPLLLHLLDRRESGSATSAQVASAMLYVESFLVRRLLIGRATANINRVMLSIVTEVDPEVAVDDAVREYLSTGRKYYATDKEVRAALPSIPYYLNGRPNQRALVLRWLEESYDSKEPVDLTSLTIEHVLPQSPTRSWRAAIAEELVEGEDVEQVYESVVHTLGNLTLTGYNSSLSNKGFDKKRPALASSGVRMNQEIASNERWGRTEIHTRAAQLADRVTRIWPGPVNVREVSESTAAWDLLEKVLATVPAGAWTTYGDLAALIGSHPVPVGMRLASHPVTNAHRVLQVAGTVSPGFRWTDPDCTDDPVDLLRAEGVEFDEQKRASRGQHLDMGELAQLAGINGEGGSAVPDPSVGQSQALRDSFVEQLQSLQSPGTVHGLFVLLKAWTDAGGTTEYGTAAETSCFLLARPWSDPRGSIWPVAIYPSGKVEVVFQHLVSREPFEDPALREEFRGRLNATPGVDIAAAKIDLRPGFDLTVLADEGAREHLVEQLSWFLDRARGDESAAEAAVTTDPSP